MTRDLTRRVARTVALILAVSVPVSAQQAASIRGTIRDGQGETVAGAVVTALNVDTGFDRSTVTGAVGTYALTQLPLGNYVMTVEAKGCRTLVVQNVLLNVADNRRIDGIVEEGAVADRITVTSSNVAAETLGGEVASLVTGEQIRELPLNGRNFLQLTQLMPGVATADNFDTKDKGLFGDEAAVSIAGGRANANLYTVDGANNNDVGSNRTILVYPSLEAIEEFKIHRNAYGAEFGGAGGAQINLVTRGGTNELHGSVFYFARRGDWNETNYILKREGVEPDDLTRDDYGFTLGGPLMRDKLHFFVSTERNDETRGSAVSAAVPTAAEKRGDFSRSDPACRPIPVDPLTFQPFPGNVIPPERLSEAGQSLLQLYPDPTVSGCFNWVTALDVPVEWNQINARLDWSLTDRARLMVRYTEDDWQNRTPTAGGANGLWGDDPFPTIDSNWAYPGESLVAQLSNTIGDTALNTLTFSLSGNEVEISQAGDSDLQERIRATYPPIFPAEGKLSYPGTAHPIYFGGGGLWWFGQQAPWFNDQDLLLLKDDYTQVFGNHLLKAGFLYTDGHKLEPTGSSGWEVGTLWGSTGLGGWGATSGNIVADFLLQDMTFGFSEFSHTVEADLEWTDIELYAADSWKLRDNMTLDFGVRYSKFYWPENANPNEYLSFNPERFDPALGASPCNGLMQVPGTDPCGEAGFPGASDGPNAALIRHDDNIAPRLGFAWDVFSTGKSVLRAGFGQFYQRDAVGLHLGLLINPPAVRFARNGIRSLDGEILVLDGIATDVPLVGFEVDAKNPFMYQYNLTWEQRLGRDSTLEVSYVGSQGHNLQRSRDINQVPPSRDVDGNGVNDRLDYVRCGSNDGACRGRYRPITAWGDHGFWYYAFDGRSEYHSLQTQLVTRFGRGSQLQASYTLADFTANASTELMGAGFGGRWAVTDIYRPDSDDGNADMRRRHVFNSSLIYNLPSFEGQGGAKEWLLGNWSIGGIVIYASGTPLTVFSGTSSSGELDGVHPAEIGAGPTRPLATGEPCKGRGDLGVINPAAYTLTGYELGNSAQQMPRGTCDGPDFFQTDLAIYKSFPMAERFNVQFRLEIFNLFNTVNLIGWSADLDYSPSVTLNAPRHQATVVTATGEPSSTFGLATGARDARQFQVGVKFSF